MRHRRYSEILLMSACIALMIFCGDCFATPNASQIQLTGAEKKWLEDHRDQLIVAPSPDWPPLDIRGEDDSYNGLAADYLGLIEKQLGISFTVKWLPNTSEALKQIKDGEITIITSTAPTPERSNYLLFTKPYIEVPTVIVVRKDCTEEISIRQLSGRVVAVGENYAAHEYLLKECPGAIVHPVKRDIEGLWLLSMGEVDAILIDLATLSYYMEKSSISNLRIAAESGHVYRAAFASRADWPELNSILNKGLANITHEQRDQIYKRWISLGDLSPFNNPRIRLFMEIGGIMLLFLIIAAIAWLYTLKKTLRIKSTALQKEFKRREKIELQLMQSQKMETLGTLASGIAHDFNNVLGGIMATVSLLQYKIDNGEDIPKDQLESYLRIVSDGTVSAATVVKQIMALSRNNEQNLAPVDLNQTVKNVIKMCKNSIDKSIELATNYTDEKAVVLADYVQIEQVLLNLCVNAAHAMTIMRPEGIHWGGLLDISIKRRHADQLFLQLHPDAKPVDYWELSVSDSGVGMNDEQTTRIFEPFYTTKGEGRGTGLGLAMVTNILQSFGGFISVYSEVGVGSTFNVYLPAQSEELLAIKSKTKETLERGSGLILVADDDHVMRKSAAAILEECGYQVLLAADGKEALELYKTNSARISVVFFDLTMPRLSGLELYHELQHINPDIKTLLASGLKSDQRVISALEQGVCGFIQKPYSMIDLSKAMANVIKMGK